MRHEFYVCRECDLVYLPSVGQPDECQGCGGITFKAIKLGDMELGVR